MNINELKEMIQGKPNENAQWWKGLVAGVAGGLAGAAAMRLFEHFVQDDEERTEAVFSPTVKATNALREVMNKRPLHFDAAKDIQKTAAIPFGAVLGAGYGLLVEHFPIAKQNQGLGLSTLVYSAVNKKIEPPMTVMNTVTKNPLKPENRELISLAIFGITTEFTRRGVRKLLGEEES